MTKTRAADSEITWGAYLRLSRLKSGKGRGGRRRNQSPDASVERQLRRIRAYAGEHGLTLDEALIFRDNGRSAWKVRRDADGGVLPPYRPGWDDMLAAGKAGKFGGLLTWKLDRFARNVRDGEDLLDLGVLLDGPDSGRIDLRTSHGKSMFRKQVEAATHYSNETSDKVRDAFAEMLEDGYRVGGSGRLFGFEVLSRTEAYEEWQEDADEDERWDGPAAVVREDEAEIIRELARRLLAGDTVASMCDDLNKRGVTTTRGGPWQPANLSRTLGNPLYGGKLAYKGEIIGTLANVEPILDAETYDAVQAKLGARRRGRKATGLHPLTGIMLCGNPDCPRKGTMAGYTRTGGKRAYICAVPGKVRGCGQSVLAGPVEAIVRDAVLTELADAERLEAMRAADTALDEQRAKLRAELDDLDADMAETEAKLSAVPRSMTRRREQITRNLTVMTARYESAERELGELGPAAAPAPPLPALSAEQWETDTTAAEKAAIIARLGLRITIRLPRRLGASRLPFDDWRVLIEPAR